MVVRRVDVIVVPAVAFVVAVLNAVAAWVFGAVLVRAPLASPLPQPLAHPIGTYTTVIVSPFAPFVLLVCVCVRGI